MHNFELTQKYSTYNSNQFCNYIIHIFEIIHAYYSNIANIFLIYLNIFVDLIHFKYVFGIYLYHTYIQHIHDIYHVYEDTCMTLFLVVRMQVNYAESRLRHKLFPLNAWMRVTNFNVLKSCPKTLLRTYYPCHCPQIHKGQTSTLRDRVWTSNSAVLTDLARDRAEAAMYMLSLIHI